MDARGITKALGGKWAGRYGLARCPAHEDREPSLKVSDDARKADGIDVHCFAGCHWSDIKAVLIRAWLLPGLESCNSAEGSSVEPPSKSDDDSAEKIKLALKIWDVSAPLPGTLGWKYLTETRGLDVGRLGDLGHALRWHNGFGAIIALMTTPAGNEPCGIHRTFLNADGTKRERKMLGKQGVVRLTRDEDVTHGLGICEGLEDGLAILLLGWGPIWAATSCGAIERFPVLPGFESLTIFADADDAGLKAARVCAERWIAVGNEADIVLPGGGHERLE